MREEVTLQRGGYIAVVIAATVDGEDAAVAVACNNLLF